MLLRRIIEHVRSQNWTAIGIDFVIVVVGVFIGIQAANWNEVRVENARADDILERFRDDIQADLGNFEHRMRFWREVENFGETGLAYASDPRTSGIEPWQALVALFHASQVGEYYTRRAVFDELKSAGELNLIRDVGLRNALTGYYNEADNPTLTERPVYREHVRGLIPIEIQDYLWSECFAATSQQVQEFIACPSPVSEERARDIANRLAGDEQLMAELRYWTSTMKIIQLISQNQIDRAKDALALVEAEMAR